MIFFNWQITISIYAGVGLIIFLLTLVYIKDKPHQENKKIKQLFVNLFKSMKQLTIIIKNKNNWLSALYFATIYAPVSILGTIWGYSFFTVKFHNNNNAASIAVSVMFIGITIGSPLGGLITTKCKSLKTVIYIGAFLSALLLFIIILGSTTTTMTIILMFLFGLFVSWYLPIFSITLNHNPRLLSATAMAFINMASMLGGGVILQPVIGELLESHWRGNIINNQRVYLLTTYQHALIILPILLVIAFLVCFLIKEKTEA